MQRAAHRPRADNGAIGNGVVDVRFADVWKAKADRPFSAGVVLRLNRAQVRDHLGRSTKVLLGDLLVAQPQTRDADAAHRVPY